MWPLFCFGKISQIKFAGVFFMNLIVLFGFEIWALVYALFVAGFVANVLSDRTLNFNYQCWVWIAALLVWMWGGMIVLNFSNTPVDLSAFYFVLPISAVYLSTVSLFLSLV